VQLLPLVGQDGAAVQQQAANQRALAVVDAAGRQEAQRRQSGRGHGGLLGVGEGVHQK
jgi:hypothetical protein